MVRMTFLWWFCPGWLLVVGPTPAFEFDLNPKLTESRYVDFTIAVNPGQAKEWTLVWSDEFDDDGLPDSTRWDYEEGFIRNRELQYYTRARTENARVENGMLMIAARKEKLANPAYEPGTDTTKSWKKSREYAEYTSASLITLGRADWKYGRIEIRAKLPSGKGMWPAIWMLGLNRAEVGWPACGEIDIMENVGFDPDLIHANIHTKAYNHVLKTNKGAKINIPGPYETFHVYAIEWLPDRIDFFVDDQKYFTFNNENQGNDTWPFDKAHYLIINAAIGGTWGGKNGVEDGIFPQLFYVDYVRIYQ